ncbi:hydrogenase small subunit [Thiorhodococcus mannitoliphagus]|uniref:hydrogenase (acceptor) n=1 Tax=Thiorhodococcus mannitoliphagus TaxID=329406 RepID=A0A6P1DYD9_9GAMM|nr:hydrogenase small subunit [Thiorhodococcus mannitoliphagus]NEX20595.1 hydrogenase small subunit [Thiorhodococcus mannitoliphagus]
MREQAQSLVETDIGPHLSNQLEIHGVSRRSFLKFALSMTAAMGLPFGMMPEVLAALEQSQARPTVIWLHFQECTGCTESLLRATHPTVESLILDLISLDYSETLLAAAGHQAEQALADSIARNRGNFILVVEGSVPMRDGGIYCKVARKTPQEMLHEIAPQAAAVVAIGSCASWGGVQSAAPNPTEAVGIPVAFEREGITKSDGSPLPVITLPGCPASPYNLLSTVLYYLTLKRLPELDAKGRPLFAYGRLIHENCERRPHFDAGRFAEEFGDEGHRKGWCLYKLGCKGPETYANCPAIEFGDVGANTWPVGIGHPCFGCAEQGVGFHKALHDQADVKSVTPPAFFPQIFAEHPGGASLAGAAVAGAVGGGAAVYALNAGKKLKQAEAEAPAETDSESR